MLDILLVSATFQEHNDCEIEGIPIHQIGVGKINAAVNTLQLIKSKKPDIVIFDSNTYSQLLELNKPTGWLSRIWFWSIITPSITIIARRIKGMSQPIFYQGQFIDIAIMIVILLIMLLVLAY